MKYLSISLTLLLVFLIGCKNNENDLLEKQQKLLESQMFSISGDIKALYFYNKNKYWELNQTYEKLNKSYYIVKNDFENNINEINDIISFYKQQGYTNLYVDFSSDIKEVLNTKDECLKTYILNNYLILINDLLDSEIKKSLSRGFHFTNIKPYIELEKKKFSLGEEVKAKIFIKATDTTQKPLYLIHNGIVLDSFNYEGDGVYSVFADKKGNFKVKGILLFPKSGSLTEIDSCGFEFDYIVK